MAAAALVVEEARRAVEEERSRLDETVARARGLKDAINEFRGAHPGYQAYLTDVALAQHRELTFQLIAAGEEIDTVVYDLGTRWIHLLVLEHTKSSLRESIPAPSAFVDATALAAAHVNSVPPVPVPLPVGPGRPACQRCQTRAADLTFVCQVPDGGLEKVHCHAGEPCLCNCLVVDTFPMCGGCWTENVVEQVCENVRMYERALQIYGVPPPFQICSIQCVLCHERTCAFRACKVVPTAEVASAFDDVSLPVDGDEPMSDFLDLFPVNATDVMPAAAVAHQPLIIQPTVGKEFVKLSSLFADMASFLNEVGQRNAASAATAERVVADVRALAGSTHALEDSGAEAPPLPSPKQKKQKQKQKQKKTKRQPRCGFCAQSGHYKSNCNVRKQEEIEAAARLLIQERHQAGIPV